MLARRAFWLATFLDKRKQERSPVRVGDMLCHVGLWVSPMRVAHNEACQLELLSPRISFSGRSLNRVHFPWQWSIGPQGMGKPKIRASRANGRPAIRRLANGRPAIRR